MIKINKKLLLIALVFVLIISAVNLVYAIENTELFKVEPEVEGNNEEFSDMLGGVLRIIRVVGIFLAVGGIFILGIQTMLGSVEEKAVYKQKFLPFIIGMIILVCATTIVSTIFKIVSDKERPTLPPPHHGRQNEIEQ